MARAKKSKGDGGADGGGRRDRRTADAAAQAVSLDALTGRLQALGSRIVALEGLLQELSSEVRRGGAADGSAGGRGSRRLAGQAGGRGRARS